MRYWLDTDSAIARDDLASPSESIGDANPLWLAHGKPQLKILIAVISAVPINVMNIFARKERSLQSLLHNMAMLKHPLVRLQANPNIAILCEVLARSFWLAVNRVRPARSRYRTGALSLLVVSFTPATSVLNPVAFTHHASLVHEVIIRDEGGALQLNTS